MNPIKKAMSKAKGEKAEKRPKGYWDKGIQNYDTGKINKAKGLSPNPKGVMEKNNKTMMEIDEHNRSWNGKKYTK